MPNHPDENEGAVLKRISDLFDRMAKASPETTDPEDLKKARKWVHGYHCKFAADPNPHPPTDRLGSCSDRRPEHSGLHPELIIEAKPAGNTYTWYVIEAIEHVHGIEFRRDPDFTRKNLQLHQGAPGSPTPSTPPPC